MQHKTVSVATTATKVFDAATEGKHGAHIIVYVAGANTVRFGGSDITNTTGLPVATTARQEFHNSGTDIYAAAATGATDVVVVISPKRR